MQTWSDFPGEPSLCTTIPRIAPVPTVSWALAVEEHAKIAPKTIASKRPKRGIRPTTSLRVPAARSVPRRVAWPATVMRFARKTGVADGGHDVLQSKSLAMRPFSSRFSHRSVVGSWLTFLRAVGLISQLTNVRGL